MLFNFQNILQAALFLIYFFYPLLTECRYRKIIWEQDFCIHTESHRLSVTDVYLPFNGACNKFCTHDVLTFIHNKSFPYDNVYRVNSREEMENCNAINAINSAPFLFDTDFTVTISNSGGEPFYHFFGFQPAYFISTSNGTRASAESDKIRYISCLQLSFDVYPENSQDCTSQDTLCTSSTLNNSNLNNLGCKWVDPTSMVTSSATNSIPTTTTTTTTTITKSVPSHSSIMSTIPLTVSAQHSDTNNPTTSNTNKIVTYSVMAATTTSIYSTTTRFSPIAFINDISIGTIVTIAISIMLIAFCFLAVPCVVIYSLILIRNEKNSFREFQPSPSSIELDLQQYQNNMLNTMLERPFQSYTDTSFLDMYGTGQTSRATSSYTDREPNYENINELDFLPKSATQINNRPNHSTTNSTVYSV